MSSTDSAIDEESAAVPLGEPTSELIFGPGQAAWLALVTVVALVALATSFVALVNSTGGSGGEASPIRVGPTTELDVEGVDFSFDPSEAIIVADTDVAVSFANNGAVEHNWTVLEQGVEIASEAEFDEATVVASIAADAGASDDGTVNLPAGTYQLICTVPGHLSAGMQGTLESAAP